MHKAFGLILIVKFSEERERNRVYYSVSIASIDYTQITRLLAQKPQRRPRRLITCLWWKKLESARTNIVLEKLFVGEIALRGSKEGSWRFLWRKSR